VVESWEKKGKDRRRRCGAIEAMCPVAVEVAHLLKFISDVLSLLRREGPGWRETSAPAAEEESGWAYQGKEGGRGFRDGGGSEKGEVAAWECG
jgi:hypothetical protein